MRPSATIKAIHRGLARSPISIMPNLFQRWSGKPAARHAGEGENPLGGDNRQQPGGNHA